MNTISIKYQNHKIAELEEKNTQAILLCKNLRFRDDIIVFFNLSGSIIYDSKIVKVAAGNKAILKCKHKKGLDNITIQAYDGATYSSNFILSNEDYFITADGEIFEGKEEG